MNVILLIQLLFAGYFKDVQSITPVLRWIRWISAFYYAFESLVINEIAGISFTFTVSSPAPFFAARSFHTCFGRMCA